jgi:hypothetical protein
MEKNRLTKEDFALIKTWKGGMGRATDIATNVAKQGWISTKQRQYLQDCSARLAKRHSQGFDGDYNEEDYEIGAYELCVGEWGD